MEEDDHYPYWRRIWQITSGNIKNVTKEEVQNTLYSHKEDIIQNVLIFKKAKTSPQFKLNTTEDIISFVSRTANYLNVDMNVAWKILKSYIINEYCGSIKSIKKLKYEMQILPMLNNIWRFYTSERMFIIKTLKCTIEFMNDPDHPFSDIYRSFIEGIELKNIWKILLQEYEYLISEISIDTSSMNQTMVRLWVERNHCELVDILHCLIMFCRHVNVQLSHFQQVLSFCKKHGFGSEPLSYSIIAFTDPETLAKLKYAEVALLLSIANKLWTRKDLSWYQYDTNMNREIAPLAYRPEHGAVCYIWVTLHLVLKNKKEIFDENFYKLTRRAVSLGCFKFFHEITTHEMFQEAKVLVGACVQDAIYNMLVLSCQNFDGEGELICFSGVAQLTSELLRNRHICERYFRDLKDIDGYVSLWSAALEMYPENISDLSLLAEAIILSGSSLVPQVINILNQLPWCAEKYVPSQIEHTPRRHSSVQISGNIDTIKLLSNRILSNVTGVNIQIPSGTEAIIRRSGGNVFIHYKFSLNYWQIFAGELNHLLSSPDDVNINAVCNKIYYGFRLLLAILKTDYDIVRQPDIMDIIMGNFAILERFSAIDNPPILLLATCLDICAELLRKFRNNICAQLETFKFLPSLAKTHFTYAEIFNINFLEPGKIGNLILSSERCADQHVILMAYLNFLRMSFMVTDGSLVIVELPGLVFVLKEIIPHFMFWYNKGEKTYLEALYQLVHFLFEMFQSPNEKLQSDEFLRMREIAYHCFLNEVSGRCLLRILSVGNSGVQNVMQGQTNWHSGSGIKYISVIQKAMAILIQLVTQRKKVVNYNGLTPLEHLIYTENDSARYVQAIASFINHPFNEAIPNLACRLLKKFAVELQMSLLAALDLEPDQVRLMFIQRLRDHLECEELKLAIIEFISACIPKQPGMTEAFFKIAEITTTNSLQSSLPASSPEPPTTTTTTTTTDSPEPVISSTTQNCFNEGIGSFLVEYLNTCSNENSHLSNPLLSRVMELMHILWMNQKEILIAYITKDEHFWPSLCYPLFSDICFSNKTYSEIINIMAKEIHKRNGNIDDQLKVVINKLFSLDESHLDKWMNHIFQINCEDNTDIDRVDMPATSGLVLAWKDFLIIAIKYLPGSVFSVDMQVKLADICRKTLKNQVLYLYDNSVMTFLSEIYLFLITNWNDNCFKEYLNFYSDIVDILQKTALSYLDLPKRFRESILSIAVLTVRGLGSFGTQNTTVIQTFIKAIGNIFNAEFDMFMHKCDNHVFQDSSSVNNQKENISFLLCLEALNELIIIRNDTNSGEYDQWFGKSQLLYKLMICVKRFLEQKSTLSVAKIVLETLIHYAQSGNTSDFLYSDIALNLWEKLQPVPQYRHLKYLGLEILPWNLLEWWNIYKRVIILLNVLLEKHSYIFLKEILMFVSLHEEYIIEILLLERQTVDPIALDLITTLLMFLQKLFHYQKFWRDDHEQSLHNILDTIKMCMNCSLIITLRPNLLKYYTINSTGSSHDDVIQDPIPTDILIDAINKLSDIVTLTANCLSQFSPPLYILLRDYTDYSRWPLLIGTNFGMPTLGDQGTSELTFGSLLCISSLYVRILQQMSNTKKVFQVTSPREILVARKSRLATFSKQDDGKESSPKPKSDENPKEDGGVVNGVQKDCAFCFPSVRRTVNKSQSESVGIVRVEYLYHICGIPTVESFTSYSSPGKSFVWFSKLSEDKIHKALEAVISLLGSQVSLILHHNNLIEREERLIKRELTSELQTFHDFVKKRLSDVCRHSLTDRSHLNRKKFGFTENKENDSSQRRIALDESVSNSKAAASKRSFDISGICSLSTNSKSSQQASEDSGTGGSTCSSGSGSSNKTPIESNTAQLYEVKLNNEDYLHFLSIWFSYVLQYISNE